MKNHLLSVRSHRRTAGTIQRPSIPTTHQQRTPRLRIRAPHRTRRRVTGIVIRPVVAITAEEKIIGAGDKDETGCLDKRTVGGVTVEDLGCGAGRSDAVGGDGLQHDGGGVRAVAVTAGAAAAEAVAVDFVDDVEGAGGVGEAGGVDGATLASWRGELAWGARRGVGKLGEEGRKGR